MKAKTDPYSGTEIGPESMSKTFQYCWNNNRLLSNPVKLSHRWCESFCVLQEFSYNRCYNASLLDNIMVFSCNHKNKPAREIKGSLRDMI